jgi:hypothetical protein
VGCKWRQDANGDDRTDIIRGTAPLTESAFALQVDSAEAQAAFETSPRMDVMLMLRRFGAWLLGSIAIVWLGVWVWRRFGLARIAHSPSSD